MQEFLAITVFIMLAAISPGPDFVIVAKNTVAYSRKTGIYTAAGIAISMLVHASYSLLGLAIIIAESLLIFNIIKYIGAGYLIYIGIKSLMAKRDKQSFVQLSTSGSLSNFQALNQGLLCNLLNPKAIMFFLAFFTVVVSPTTPVSYQIGLAVEIAVIHMLWFSLLSLLISHKQVKPRLEKAQYYIVKVMGGILVLFGIRIALLEKTL